MERGGRWRRGWKGEGGGGGDGKGREVEEGMERGGRWRRGWKGEGGGGDGKGREVEEGMERGRGEGINDKHKVQFGYRCSSLSEMLCVTVLLSSCYRQCVSVAKVKW